MIHDSLIHSQPMSRLMKKLSTLSLLLALVLLVTPQQAEAQTTVELGPRLGFDLGDLEELFIGADARIASDALPVLINPSFDYYFVSSGVEGVDVSAFTIDVNALYEFGVDNEAFTPYAGGGLGIVRFSSSVDDSPFGGGGISASTTDVGLNLVGGAKFETGNLQPFAQAKINVGGDFTLFGLMGGLLFSL